MGCVRRLRVAVPLVLALLAPAVAIAAPCADPDNTRRVTARDGCLILRTFAHQGAGEGAGRVLRPAGPRPDRIDID